jgi:hypothetical protein
MNKAYEYTFREVYHTKQELEGYNRKIISPKHTPDAKFILWQEAVSRSPRDGVKIKREVEDNFQATKHLMGCPRPGDKSLKSKEPLDPKWVIKDETAETPRFTWSPSKLLTFETCPAKFAAESYYKTALREENEASIWGTRVHRQAELFMLGDPIDDEEAFKPVEQYCHVLSQLEGQRFVEHKIALDEHFMATDWDTACGRMILDLGFLSPDGKTLRIFDWKTGKMKQDLTQMQIYAAVLALLMPQVETVKAQYIWLKEKKTTGFTADRQELMPILKDIGGRLKRMKEAWDNENFPERKTGLCRQYCGNLECPHNGRR